MGFRIFLLIILHAFVIIFLSITHSQAKEDEWWHVEELGNYIITGVSGEVVHGDRLRFAIKKSDCNKMSILFSFSTTKKTKEIKKLQDESIPIRINNFEQVSAAEIIAIHTMGDFMSIVMMQAPGLKSVKEMVGAIMTIYKQEKNFSIELLDEGGFNPDYYFDILKNNWKLDLLPYKIEQAQRMCYGPITSELS